MISRFAFVIVAAGSICFTALPVAAEDVGVGVGPAGVTIGDHDRDRDRDRDHDKTTIIRKDHNGDREKTIIKKERDD
jgi:hypothetical protein